MIADSIFPDVSLPLAEKAHKGTDAKCFYDFYRPMVYINFFFLSRESKMECNGENLILQFFFFLVEKNKI